MTSKLDHSPEAYVIADYLLTAAIRLRISPREVLDNVRECVTRLPTEEIDVQAALAFLDMMECATEDESFAKVIQNKAEQKAQVILLNLMMPNGKMLSDCTRRDCQELSIKVGPWMGALAKRLKGNQTIGKTLSEEDVRKLYQKSPP